VPISGKLRSLIELVAGFHLRAGSMRRAQQRIEAQLATGNPIPQREIEAYLAQTRRYFSEFEREAREHLKDVEKRLVHVGQLQYNLTAERGVALRRVEVTKGVLSTVEGFGNAHQGA
jgi:hypothetical protein